MMRRYVLMGSVLLLWGLWGFLPKLAVSYLGPKSAMFYQSLGGFLVALLVLGTLGFRPDVHWPSAGYSLAAGMAAILGSLILLYLLRSETVTVAIGVTALYPVVTILLAALVLGELPTPRQGVGILLSCAALVLLAA